MKVITLTEPELTDDISTGIAQLACRSFDSDRTVEDRIADLKSSRESNSTENQTIRRFLIFDEQGKVVAHSKTFIRRIIAESNELEVLALATVCSDPDLRGQGLGAAVTQAAFSLVVNLDWPKVSLFQTPVPAFYEKLNCRIIRNRFVDRTNNSDPEANPWRDDIIMIHPTEFNWPEGTIDLNGPDY